RTGIDTRDLRAGEIRRRGPHRRARDGEGHDRIRDLPGGSPETVARIVELVNKGFYNGLRFHRAEANFLIQVGDPVSRDVTREADWGGGGTGKPIGASEVTKKRRHLLGAVSMAYPGTQRRAADSQFFIMRRPAPELDGKYTVFGKI